MVAAWSFTPWESAAAIAVYSGLITGCLLAVQAPALRAAAAFVSGLGHTAIGALHVVRLVHPFRFEVFGYRWPIGATLREALLVLPFGLVSIALAASLRRRRLFLPPAGARDPT